MNIYRADYADGEMEVFHDDNDDVALNRAWEGEKEHGQMFNLALLDDNYDEVKTIC